LDHWDWPTRLDHWDWRGPAPSCTSRSSSHRALRGKSLIGHKLNWRCQVVLQSERQGCSIVERGGSSGFAAAITRRSSPVLRVDVRLGLGRSKGRSVVACTHEEWASVLIGAGPACSSLSRVSVQWRQAGHDRNELICLGSEWLPKPLRCHGLQPVITGVHCVHWICCSHRMAPRGLRQRSNCSPTPFLAMGSPSHIHASAVSTIPWEPA